MKSLSILSEKADIADTREGVWGGPQGQSCKRRCTPKNWVTWQGAGTILGSHRLQVARIMSNETLKDATCTHANTILCPCWSGTIWFSSLGFSPGNLRLILHYTMKRKKPEQSVEMEAAKNCLVIHPLRGNKNLYLRCLNKQTRMSFVEKEMAGCSFYSISREAHESS